MVDYGKYVYRKKINQTDSGVKPAGAENNALVVYDPARVEEEKQKLKARKKKLSKLKSFETFAFAVFLFLILGIVSITYFDFKQAKATLNEDDDGNVFYAVKIISCVDYATAKYYGIEVRKRFGAGYLKKADESFDVICAVYPDKESAEKVVDALKKDNPGAGVVKLTVPYLKRDFPKEISDALNVYSFCFSQLYDISTRLDKGEITERDATYLVKILKTEVEAVGEKIKYLTLKDEYKEEYIKILSEISMAQGCLENIVGEAAENLLPDIRYYTAQILCGFSDLISSLNGAQSR